MQNEPNNPASENLVEPPLSLRENLRMRYWFQPETDTSSLEELQQEIKISRIAAERFNLGIYLISTTICSSLAASVGNQFYLNDNQLSPGEVFAIIGALFCASLPIFIGYHCSWRHKFSKIYSERPLNAPNQDEERINARRFYNFIPNIFITVLLNVIKAIFPALSAAEANKLANQAMPISKICEEVFRKYGLTMVGVEIIVLILTTLFNYGRHKIEENKIFSMNPSQDGYISLEKNPKRWTPLFLGKETFINLLRKVCNFSAVEIASTIPPSAIIAPSTAFFAGINWQALITDKVTTKLGTDVFNSFIVGGFIFLGLGLLIACILFFPWAAKTITKKAYHSVKKFRGSFQGIVNYVNYDEEV